MDMIDLVGTGIFWTTLGAIAATLSLATLIGRGWSVLLPYRVRALACFYLAPALGLASLILIASAVGRMLPLGDSVAVPLLIVGLLIWALAQERQPVQAFRQALVVSVFGIICGISVLAPLFIYGAFNAHNDAFTYLVHGNWLQEHAFRERVSAEAITPLTTQVEMYQKEGFRMGASYLLALLQSLLNLRWSYEAYPAVVVSAIAVSCLAMGFPLAGGLRRMGRPFRLALLALPSFSLGGLVFGANLGFLPQTVGIALGSASLFMVGPLFSRIATARHAFLRMAKPVFPAALLLAASVYAYSEFAPFLLASVLGSSVFLALRFRAIKRMLAYTGLLMVFALLLLNAELLRAYAALRTQSEAVVGTPVEWSLLGYFAHALGIHGGAWDGFQWTAPTNSDSRLTALGLALLSIVLAAGGGGARAVGRAIMNGILTPVFVMVVMLICGSIYFRYGVPSPFPVGVGQSWSQFKLSDWAHPFTMAMLLLAVAALRARCRKVFDRAVAAMFTVGILGAAFVGTARVTPVMDYYGKVHDLNEFYYELRQTVLRVCSQSPRVYLALEGPDHKFRQMAVLYLYDRNVISDWTDDGYIYPRLPMERRKQELRADDCVVEPMAHNSWLRQGTPVGRFLVGSFDGEGRIKVVSATGAYDAETDGTNRWYWVDHDVTFKLHPLSISEAATQTRLAFEYGTRGEQVLTLRLTTRDQRSQQITLQKKNGSPETFDTLIDLPPAELNELSIETNGQATPLGNGDQRTAAFIVRNLSISPVSPMSRR